MGRVGTVVHLATRFLGSLSPRPLAPRDDAWARSTLGAGEADLWNRMSRADRKHAAGVAREVADRLGEGATRPVVAAALLHDVGKVDAALGTFGRVLSTVVIAVVGRTRVGTWHRHGGRRARIASYAQHDRIGGRLLADAGADPLTVAWAREHHRPPTDWTVPAHVGAVLRAVDDD